MKSVFVVAGSTKAQNILPLICEYYRISQVFKSNNSSLGKFVIIHLDSRHRSMCSQIKLAYSDTMALEVQHLIIPLSSHT